jgi:hypothetical protein
MPNRFLAYSFLPLAAAAVVASPAVAALHPLGTITACRSLAETGCPTAQVRHGQLGLEYRTANGRWVRCAGDCKDALRRAAVDFWEDQTEVSR